MLLSFLIKFLFLIITIIVVIIFIIISQWYHHHYDHLQRCSSLSSWSYSSTINIIVIIIDIIISPSHHHHIMIPSKDAANILDHSWSYSSIIIFILILILLILLLIIIIVFIIMITSKDAALLLQRLTPVHGHHQLLLHRRVFDLQVYKIIWSSSLQIFSLVNIRGIPLVKLP